MTGPSNRTVGYHPIHFHNKSALGRTPFSGDQGINESIFNIFVFLNEHKTHLDKRLSLCILSILFSLLLTERKT